MEVFLFLIRPHPHRTAFQWLTVWSCVKLPSFIYVAPRVGSFAISNFLFLSLGTEFHPSFVSPYMCCKFRFSFLKKKKCWGGRRASRRVWWSLLIATLIGLRISQEMGKAHLCTHLWWHTQEGLPRTSFSRSNGKTSQRRSLCVWLSAHIIHYVLEEP